MTTKSAYLSYVLECDICNKIRDQKDIMGVSTLKKDKISEYSKTSIAKADWHICHKCIKQIVKLSKN